ncbi:hypothetical protein KP509_30G017500 [Ceratopteris richardii]|uniref:Hpc2-related domain-containing protein n=1 Tax=Ceratopteris richardii TaxID=49495 RepID=A0A8T2R0E4_CERRI|nr:hypothetical protein KP509_30G017500 [Ceratopteris richardii]
MPNVVQARAMLDNRNCQGTGLLPFSCDSPSACLTMPSRERFYVELKPGETTFVSWRKLLRESQKSEGLLFSCCEAPTHAQSTLQACVASDIVSSDQSLNVHSLLPSSSNRLGSVIGKIEGLYQRSTSDEEFHDFMDEVKYDARDPFVPDTELGMENAKLKHSGFFINRGKLETEVKVTLHIADGSKMKEKKKLNNGEEVKVVKSIVRLKAAARGLPPTNGLSPSSKSAILVGKNKSVCDLGREMGEAVAMTVVAKELNVAGCNDLFISDIAGNKTENKLSKDGFSGDKMAVERVEGRISGKHIPVGFFDMNGPFVKDDAVGFEPNERLSISGVESKSIQKDFEDENRKESPLRQKILTLLGKDESLGHNRRTALEKAFLELERDVAELYPPSLATREPEQGKRNRLPRDLKQKLAKVARLAAKQGQITDDIIERLMGILGHVIRERTLKRHLKRHLKMMIEMGVPAMQDGCFLSINEVTKPSKSKEACPWNELQSLDLSSENASGEGCYKWDPATEAKGLYKNKEPHMQKLYEKGSEGKAKIKQSKLTVEDLRGDGLKLLQLFTPGDTVPALNEKINTCGHEAQLLLQEQKFSSTISSSEGKCKPADQD